MMIRRTLAGGAFVAGTIFGLRAAARRVRPYRLRGIGERRVPGKDSATAFSPSWLTALAERAAERNNEME